MRINQFYQITTTPVQIEGIVHALRHGGAADENVIMEYFEINKVVYEPSFIGVLIPGNLSAGRIRFENLAIALYVPRYNDYKCRCGSEYAGKKMEA